MMLRRVKICSLHDLPARNPACSSLSNASTSFCSLFNSTLQKTFPSTDSKVIPLQLLQSLRHPFFGNGTMTPCLHSFGTSSVCHIVLKLNNWVNCFTTASPPYCSNSAGIPSNPAALFFFSHKTQQKTNRRNYITVSNTAKQVEKASDTVCCRQ